MIDADITQFTLNTGLQNLQDALLVAAHLSRRHTHLLRRSFSGPVGLETLPDEAVVTTTLGNAETSGEVIAEVGDAIVAFSWHDANGFAVVSAPDALTALAVLDQMTARVPADDSARSVKVSFTDSMTGRRSHSLQVRPWEEIEHGFTPQVRTALEALHAFRPLDEVEPRRLILWHGQPGTGKTSAIRALLHAWRDWVDGLIVTDPDVLLQDSGYLRRAVIDRLPNDRWKLVVLEDAETLLHKGKGGTSMSRLLNLCDGLLGQGLRCLFLITTNEPLDAMHPALVRPGRCLARIEFGALPAAQASGLLGRRVDVPMTLAEVMAREPLEVHERVPVAAGQYL